MYIVIPVHNRINFTISCLDSLRNQTFKDFKIVVIDDGSTDKTSEIIKKEYPEVILLHGDGNYWWTKSINLGIKHVLQFNPKYILTMNNDTLADKVFLEKMFYWAEKKYPSLLGALAIDVQTNRPVYGGEIINWKTGSSKILLNEITSTELKGLHEVSHFPGRGLLIPTEVFKSIGLFDEKTFPHYAADYDFTLKAGRFGYKIYCNFDAKLLIYPEESGDRKNRERKNLKNYYNHLFGIKGGGNLKYFIKFGIKNCPKLFLPWFLARGSFQRLFGYWVKNT